MVACPGLLQPRAPTNGREEAADGAYSWFIDVVQVISQTKAGDLGLQSTAALPVLVWGIKVVYTAGRGLKWLGAQSFIGCQKMQQSLLGLHPY